MGTPRMNPAEMLAGARGDPVLGWAGHFGIGMGMPSFSGSASMVGGGLVGHLICGADGGDRIRQVPGIGTNSDGGLAEGCRSRVAGPRGVIPRGPSPWIRPRP